MHAFIILVPIKWAAYMVFGLNLGHVVEKVGVMQVVQKESIGGCQRKN